MRFANRTQAGEALASHLRTSGITAQVVIGLARGGVAIAAPIAKSFGSPVDVLVVKKIPSVYNPELAIGALAPDDVSVIYWRNAHKEGADEAYVHAKKEELQQLIHQKSIAFHKGKKPLDVRGKNVVVTDDGAATGATMEVAIRWLKAKKAKKIIVALPVAPPEVIARIRPEVADVVVLHEASDLASVGDYYEDFVQVTDAEVLSLLHP